MDRDVIKSLKSKLADLTCTFFVIGKEFELLIQRNEDDQVKQELREIIAELRDSNNEVIRLYHEIQMHESGLQNGLYNNIEDINNLQNTIENLRQSTEALIKGNQLFLNNTYTS